MVIVIQQTLQGIPGARNISDDIIVFGSDQESHDKNLADTDLKVGASPVRLVRSVLLQRSNGTARPGAYASRTLTDVERRYSQTEKAVGGCVGPCERCHIYLYGKQFTLYSDHEPLETIYSPKSKPPPRIERWTCTWRERLTNPADVLSRLPLENQPRWGGVH